MAEKHTSEKYRKKPVVIEAHQWNPRERPTALPDWLWNAIGMTPELFNENTGELSIRTLEGTMIANPGDWIIKGVKGELYPCKPDIFAATYEPAGIPTAAMEGEAKSVIETLRSQLACARKLLAIKPRWVCVKCGYYAGHSGCHPCKNCGASRAYWCGSFKWPADNEHCRNWIAADNARIDAALAATYEPAGIPTAALEGEGVRAAIEEARQRFNVVKEIAYKLPNKCECSGSVACVTCQLLGDIGDLEETLSRIDAALAAGEKR